MESFDVTIDLTELAEAAVHPVLCLRAFAMPLNNPANPRGRFYDREFVVITYPPILTSCLRSCRSLRKSSATRSTMSSPRMPDSTGFGEYTADGGARVIQGVNR